MQSKGIKGFSLAELLISLLILGEIATFTIPKIIAAQQAQQSKSLVKEAVGIMAGTLQKGIAEGRLNDGSSGDDIRQYFSSNINSVKVCSNGIAQGCWAGAWDTYTIVLHNGSAIGLGDVCCGLGLFWFIIDTNGPQGPNLEGVDQIYMGLNYAKQSVGGWGGWNYRSGEVTVQHSYAASTALYNSLF